MQKGAEWPITKVVHFVRSKREARNRRNSRALESR